MQQDSHGRLPVGVSSILPALVSAFVTLVVAWYGWANGSVRLDVGVPNDAQAVEGFFEREQVEHETYRWGKDDPSIRLASVPGPALLTLRLSGRGGGTPIELRGTGTAPAPFDVKALEFRRYMLLAQTPADGSDLSLVFGATAEPVPPEQRALSVLVESARIEPMRAGLPLLPLLPLLLFGAFGALAYALPRLIGAPSWLALPVALALGAGLGWWWGTGRVLVGPFLLSAVVVIGAATGLCVLMRLTAGRAGRATADGLVACFAAASALLPLWLTTDYLDDGKQTLALLSLALLLPGMLALLARGRLRALAVGLALALSLAATGLQIAGLLVDAPNLRGDFHALFRGAARLFYGTLPLYNQTAIATNPLSNTYTAPPLVAVALWPFAGLSLGQALLSWRVASLLLLIPSVWLLLSAYQKPLRSWYGLGLLLLLPPGPLVSLIADGQIGLLLLLGVSAAFWGVARQSGPALGVGLGASAALNPALLPLIALPALRGQWRALAVALATLLALSLGALAVVGATSQLVYLLGVLPALRLSTSWVENQSLAGFVNRLFEVDRLAVQPGLGGVVQQAWLGLTGAVCALTIWLTRPGRMRIDCALSLWVVGLLLALPSSWIHYQVLLAPVFFQALVVAGEEGVAWPSVACYALAWALIGPGDRFAFYDGTLYGVFWQLGLSYKTLGLALLFVGVALAGQARRPARLVNTG
jgi:hypothetical protein